MSCANIVFYAMKPRHENVKQSNPIAAKLLRKLKAAKRATPSILAMIATGADDLQTQVAAADELVGLEPAHATYVYAHNLVSVISEEITAMNEMAPFGEIIAKAVYVPSRPPISPLTTSYFTSWAFFDACAGVANETIGTIVLEIGNAFGMQPELLRIIQSMQDSRMGLYIQRGIEGSCVVLEDLVTKKVYRAISPAGYLGERSQLWYVRILPPPFSGDSDHVLFTTPYIAIRPDPGDWLVYFNRTFAHKSTARIEDYEHHMKYGPTREYWNDFVFEAYVNHRMDVIYLAGLPDVPESRPNSKVNGWGFGSPSQTH